ncbi:cellulose biosynthesis protein BcsP [Bordetella genomosp. 12]|uniref:Cellulose biosynthesis protein BcsR n=1 Tax=Bordetella genomosp. 12 TaxID=463035 RepID=A0A261VAK8_9BORD|nr:cellulose biosynthesis protein BcsP [Bordetella genomosp. 12]OZI70847.1 hypothetical protein CAL22_13165 [Bordetella genomosp. 12]
MHNGSDISSLYREFGGDPRNYREIGNETKSAAACARWPLLGKARPAGVAVPSAVGGQADRPAQAAPWPPSAQATLTLPQAEYAAVRTGAVVDGEQALALIRGARVQRPALDALVLPTPEREPAPIRPLRPNIVSADIERAAPPEWVRAAERVEPGLADAASSGSATAPMPFAASLPVPKAKATAADEVKIAPVAAVPLEPQPVSVAAVPPEPEVANQAVVPTEPEVASAAAVPPEPEVANVAVVSLEPQAVSAAAVPLEPEVASVAAVPIEPQTVSVAVVSPEPQAASEVSVPTPEPDAQPKDVAVTPLQGVFARLARSPAAGQPPPPLNTAK